MFEFSIKNWQFFVLIISAITCVVLCFRNTSQIIKGWKYPFIGIVILIIAWHYIGTRPINKVGDSELYSTIYNLVAFHKWQDFKNGASEWVWNAVETGCLEHGLTASGWFMTVAAIYFGGMAFAVYRWLPRNFTIALIFVLSSFSFGAYAYNGLRQGMAASLCIAGLSLLPLIKNKKRIIWLAVAWTLMIFGAFTHNSMFLFGIAAAVAYFVPGPKKAFYIWGICLLLSPISLTFSKKLGVFLITDSRFATYSSLTNSEQYTNLAWRWDFIIYSAIPVILAWYVIMHRKIKDSSYNLIASTYLYCNAAWLLMNNMAYSNRFAYISWCLYPFILAYPLLKMRLCPRQGLLVAGVLAIMLIPFMLL